MDKWKRNLCKAILIFVLLMLSSCWNYREVNRMAIVAGMAVDMGISKKFLLTLEILKIGGGQEVAVSQEILTTEGDTIFDAVRNLISVSGKRAYWGHVQVVIVCEDIAGAGVDEVGEWFRQDAETRGDVYLLVSMGDKAGDILKADTIAGDLISFILRDSIQNSKALGKMPVTEVARFISDVESEGISAISAVVRLRTENGRTIPYIEGSAFFDEDRLGGFIDGEETKDILFIRNEVKGGVLVVDVDSAKVALEIINSKTRVKSMLSDGKIRMEVTVETTTTIDETEGYVDFSKPENIKQIEKIAEKNISKRLEKAVKKAQNEYDVDIFGFGDNILKNHPREWKRLSEDWKTEFKNLDVRIQVKMHIKNTAMITKPSEKGS